MLKKIRKTVKRVAKSPKAMLGMGAKQVKQAAKSPRVGLSRALTGKRKMF